MPLSLDSLELFPKVADHHIRTLKEGSEAYEVLRKHITTEPDGSGRLTIPWSKIAQQGNDVVLYLGLPTMKALDKTRPKQPLIP